MTAPETAPPTPASVVPSAVGVVLALAGIYVFGMLVRTVVIPFEAQLLGSYLVVWVPLIAVVVWAIATRRMPFRALGLRFTWLDLLWGAGIGLLLRAVATLIEIAIYGQPAVHLQIGDAGTDIWWLFGIVLAPVVLGPLIEEIFFRGYMQQNVIRASTPVIGIVVTALVFALLHLSEVTSPATALVVGIATLVFGIAVGTLAHTTGRIGGAIIAHIVYNGSLIATQVL